MPKRECDKGDKRGLHILLCSLLEMLVLTASTFQLFQVFCDANTTDKSIKWISVFSGNTLISDYFIPSRRTSVQRCGLGSALSTTEQNVRREHEHLPGSHLRLPAVCSCPEQAAELHPSAIQCYAKKGLDSND